MFKYKFHVIIVCVWAFISGALLLEMRKEVARNESSPIQLDRDFLSGTVDDTPIQTDHNVFNNVDRVDSVGQQVESPEEEETVDAGPVFKPTYNTTECEFYCHKGKEYCLHPELVEIHLGTLEDIFPGTCDDPPHDWGTYADGGTGQTRGWD